MDIKHKEQRRHERVEPAGRISVRVFPRARPDGGRLEYAGHTRDLSESGACIITDTQLPVGELLDLRIAVADPPTIFLRPATVRWCSRSEADGTWRTGVEFKSRSSFADDNWRQFIRELRQLAQPVATAA